MRAIIIRDATATVESVSEDILDDRPVTVDVSHSSINYKDALVLTGRPGVVRRSPLVAGIDLVGTVRTSADARWQAGDHVILNGSGLSETEHGGLADVARVRADALVRRPARLTPVHAAGLGTAGYTAALCVLRLAGVEPGADNPILVTGATGGVGSIATLLLAAAGHHVVALTGRAERYADYLTSLGAAEVIDRAEFDAPGRPMQSQRWAASVDTVGGRVLANVLAQTRYGGHVAACGLAGGTELTTSVLPFILRSVTLAGVDSVQAPLAARVAAWDLLSTDVDLETLTSLTEVVPLDGAIDAAHRLLRGESHGRIVVDLTQGHTV